MISYTLTELNKLWSTQEFLKEYEEYKNKDIINKLVSSIFYIKKPEKKLNDLQKIKNILNTTNKENLNKKCNEIISIINDKNKNNIINTIINICVKNIHYIDLYLIIIHKILRNYEYNLNETINNLIDHLYDDKLSNSISQYDILCDINKKYDNISSISILICKFEMNNLIIDYIDKLLQRIIKIIYENIEDNDICNKNLKILYRYTIQDIKKL